MEKIILADGTEREVPTQEEFKALQEKATTATKAEEERLAAVKLAEDLKTQVNPNWQVAREKMAKQKQALEAKGVKVDDDGNIVDPQATGINMDEIKKAQVEVTTQAMLDNTKDVLISDYDDDTQKVIDVYFKKLTNGEQVTTKNIKKFVEQAIQVAVPQNKRVSPQGYGRPPITTANESQTITEQAVQIGSQFSGITKEELEKGGTVNLV
jgi:hypothetical protein